MTKNKTEKKLEEKRVEEKKVEINKQIENESFRRYVISIVSWQEEIVVTNLQERIKKQNLENDVIDFLIPYINEASIKKGQKIIKQKKLYPGYVFIKSKMNDKIRYVIRNTPGVRLIVGAETHPIPVEEYEYKKIIAQIENSKERSSLNIPYKKWDMVILKSWDFKDMQWVIRKVDEEKWTIIVNVEMLGRLTPVLIDADKIALIN